VLTREGKGNLSFILISFLVAVPLLLLQLAYHSSMYRADMLVATLFALLHDYRLYGLRSTHPVQSAAPAHLRVFLSGVGLDDISEKFVVGVNWLDMKLLRHHTRVNGCARVRNDAGCRGRLELGRILLLLLMSLVGVRV
jgi:hypothetical protein